MIRLDRGEVKAEAEAEVRWLKIGGAHHDTGLLIAALDGGTNHFVITHNVAEMHMVRGKLWRSRIETRLD